MSQWSDDQKAQALEAYVEYGPHEASRMTSVPVRTISYWAAKAGLATEVAAKNARAAEAVRARSKVVRAQLQLLLLEQANRALLAMDEEVAKPITVVEGRTRTEHWEMVPPDPNDKKNLAITVGTLLDKFRLEVGEATGRSEHRDITYELDRETRRRISEWAEHVGTDAGSGEEDGEDSAVRQQAAT